MINFEPFEISRKELSKCPCYELYSLKNQRNVKIYSQQCYYQALLLELNDKVQSYCERPCKIVVPSSNILKTRTIDFIVEYTNSNRLEMQRITYNGYNEIPYTLKKSFKEEEDWCELHGYKYNLITCDKYLTKSYYFQNIKYLYGLIRRINSPLYNKYINTLIATLQIRQIVTISEFMNENHLTAYEALLTVSLGISNGTLSLCLESEIVNTNMEVKLSRNESCI